MTSILKVIITTSYFYKFNIGSITNLKFFKGLKSFHQCNCIIRLVLKGIWILLIPTELGFPQCLKQSYFLLTPHIR